MVKLFRIYNGHSKGGPATEMVPNAKQRGNKNAKNKSQCRKLAPYPML